MVLDVAVFWGPVLTGATTTMIAPVTLLALRGHAGLPRWLGVVGAVAFAEQAVETVTIFGSTGFTEPGDAMNLQLGAGLVWGWWLAFAAWGGVRGVRRIPSERGEDAAHRPRQRARAGGCADARAAGRAGIIRRRSRCDACRRGEGEA